MAFVDPTLFCNLQCPACPTGLKAGLRPRATLDWDLYRSFIDQVGDYLFKLYLYNLGEPLLHKLAPDMISYAKQKEIFVMVSSNLSIPFQDEYLRKLVSSGLDVLVVALDGTTPETYQTYRRGGNFELVKSNMQRIQSLKRELGADHLKVVWQFLTFQHNEHEVETVKREYKAWGADEYCIGGAYMPVDAQAQGFAPSARTEFDIYDSNHLHRRKTLQAFMERKPCTWLYGATVLNANGTVSPCSYTASETNDFGSFALGSDFQAVWNSPKFHQARSLTAQKNAAWQSQEDWEAIGRRMNGRAMDVAASLAPDQLLCEKCPVPFLQDVVDHELTFNDQELFRYIESNYTLDEQESATLASYKELLGVR